ncbi:hypothetical protein ACH41H_47200 [Streptomyces sp. NPDC020800]|uniref:hypothetical protein n=1 Tax=Streptomyces sp. NPDC020800 TaxID=3365092 RepID=UPI0037988693
MLAGPPPGIYDPTGPGRLLIGFFAAMAQTERVHSNNIFIKFCLEQAEEDNRRVLAVSARRQG